MAQSIFSHVCFSKSIRNTAHYFCYGLPSNFWIKQVSSTRSNIRDFSSHGCFIRQPKSIKLIDGLSKNIVFIPPFYSGSFHIQIRLKYIRKDPKPSALLKKLQNPHKTSVENKNEVDYSRDESKNPSDTVSNVVSEEINGNSGKLQRKLQKRNNNSFENKTDVEYSKDIHKSSSNINTDLIFEGNNKNSDKLQKLNKKSFENKTDVGYSKEVHKSSNKIRPNFIPEDNNKSSDGLKRKWQKSNRNSDENKTNLGYSKELPKISISTSSDSISENNNKDADRNFEKIVNYRANLNKKLESNDTNLCYNVTTYQDKTSLNTDSKVIADPYPDDSQDDVESTENSETYTIEACSSPYLLICYDLELCDGSMAGEIYQLGATTRNSKFSTNILPEGSIDERVTKHCGGISVLNKANGQRCLMRRGDILNSTTGKEGLNSFVEWIKTTKRLGEYDNVVLCAHGALDMPVLINNLAKVHLLDEFRSVVDRFVNTEEYFVNKFPEGRKLGISSMYKKLFDQKLKNAHDALEDATALYRLMVKTSQINRKENGKNTDGEDFIHEILQKSVTVSVAEKIVVERIKRSIASMKAKGTRNKSCLHFLALKNIS